MRARLAVSLYRGSRALSWWMFHLAMRVDRRAVARELEMDTDDQLARAAEAFTELGEASRIAFRR